MKVWSKDTKHPVGFDSQHLFFDRFRTCYTSHGFERKPELLYQLGACENSKRIESALVFESPVDQDAFLNCIESKGYKPCLLTVSKDGWLTRYDLKTGVVLQNVYLSKQYKFKHVLWESDLHRIVLKSIHFSSVNRPLMYLAVFCMAPLQFQALMPIEKSVFGQDTIDATASNGFLVIMHQANKIRFYSLLEVMEKYCLAARLGKLFATSSSSNCHWDITLPFTSPFIIGEEPNGLPVNVTFTSKPVVLFEIISNQHVISFGGHPWHYIACPPAHSSVFHVRSVKDSTLVKHGILEMDSLSVEPDQAYFHADNSGRILHIGPHVIRCLKLCSGETTLSAFELKSCFSLNLKKEENSRERIRFTSSGREIKARSDQVFNNPGFETVLDVDYEDELDLLVVLRSNDCEDTPCGIIGLYDNQTGCLIHDIVIENWTQDADHSIMMEKDTIVHIMKDCNRKYSCSIYRLKP